MLGDSFTNFEIENHICLANTKTKSITEHRSSLYVTIYNDQDSLKNLWLWCNTTKLGRYKN